MNRVSDIMRSIKSLPEVQAENVQQSIRVHISELQAGLKDDEELLIYHGTGLEFIRVLQISFPNEHVLILIGHDGDGNTASAILNITGVNLTCKVVSVYPLVHSVLRPHRNRKRLQFPDTTDRITAA